MKLLEVCQKLFEVLVQANGGLPQVLGDFGAEKPEFEAI
jgi:hypothetical protein